jgi:hypothetical protein
MPHHISTLPLIALLITAVVTPASAQLTRPHLVGFACAESRDIAYYFGDPDRRAPSPFHSWLVLDSVPADSGFRAVVIEGGPEGLDSTSGFWQWQRDSLYVRWADALTVSLYAFVLTDSAFVGWASGRTTATPPIGGETPHKWRREFRAHRVSCDAPR